MRIYLDNCCYNRPYDDQTQVRISLETQAKLHKQHMIIENRLDLASSYVLMAENYANPHETRKNSILEFIEENSTVFVSEANFDKIAELAQPIIETGIKPPDAYHIACAIFAHCDFFITTDKRVLKYVTNDIIIYNPTTFLSEIED